MATPEVRQTVIGDHNLFTATGDIRITYQLPPAEAKARVALLQLADSVKQFWIAGVLERSVHEAGMIELRKEPIAEAVQHPWQRILEVPGQPARSLAVEQTIGEIFTETGRALLILGEPGAGKTITLLELARELLKDFDTDVTRAAPVVLNLSTWKARHRSLATWIEGELQSKYFVPARRTREWLGASRLLLLLDGLDEVAPESRAACVRAINEFIQNTGVPGIAVCSRLREYTALPERLTFSGAVCLQPLTAEQIDSFLEHGGSQLAAVRRVIKQDSVLQELAGSPLMLSIISLAYQGLPAETVSEQLGDSAESRRRHLFDTYVTRMFQRAGKAPDAFPEARTRLWLTWLAYQMREHSLTVFLLESLQPTWLPAFSQRWQYALVSRIASALMWAMLWWVLTLALIEATRPFLLEGTLFALLGGTVAGTVAGVIAGRRLTSAPPAAKWGERLRLLAGICVHPLILGLVFAAFAGPFFEGIERVVLGSSTGPSALQGRWFGFMAGARYGVVFGLVFGFRGARRSDAPDIRLSDRLSFSIAAARQGAMRGGIAGAVVGVILAVLSAVQQWPQLTKMRPLLLAVTLALLVLLAALLIGLVFAFIGGMFTVLTSTDLPGRTRPGQGLRSSAQNALVAGLAVGSICTIPWAVYVTLAGNVHSLRPIAMVVCGYALAAAFWYGGLDVIQHLTLRTMLRRSGWIPGRYVAFLDYATRLIFLQKVGSGYIFVHRQLLDYFAEAPPRP